MDIREALTALRAKKAELIRELIGLETEFTFTGSASTAGKAANRKSQIVRVDNKMAALRRQLLRPVSV